MFTVVVPFEGPRACDRCRRQFKAGDTVRLIYQGPLTTLVLPGELVLRDEDMTITAEHAGCDSKRNVGF
jgi:hypothetical protein